MKELIDLNENIKMVAMLFGALCYDRYEYLIYSIKRNSNEANVFVSKLVKTSSGYVISHNFDNGEKEVLDKIIQRILSKESLLSLEKDGYTFKKNVELDGVNYFDVRACYVATVSIDLIKSCLVYYDLIDESFFKQPVVDIIEDNKKFNSGFIGNVFIILFGIFILIFGVSVIISTFFK